MRVPPKVVRSTTMPGGSAAISPMRGGARRRAGAPAARPARRRPRRARRRRRPCPRWRRTAGRCRAGRRRRDRGVDRQAGLVEHHGQVGVAGQLVADGAHAATGRVAQPPGRRGRRAAAPPPGRRAARCRSGCRPRGRGRPGEHHRHAVVGDGARHQHDVARLHLVGSEVAPGRDDADAGGGDVEPVGGAPLDHLGVAGDDVRLRPRPPPRPCRRATAAQLVDRRSPPRCTNAADSHARRAPCTARSLTVPCTARWPIEPPGKARGLHDERVGAEREPLARRRGSAWRRRAAARRRRRRRSRKTASTSAADALPPAPWASVTTSSVRRGRRRRNASMRSRTAASRPSGARRAGSQPSGTPPVERSAAPPPQGEAQRGLGLLDPVDAVGPHDQAVVDVRRRPISPPS